MNNIMISVMMKWFFSFHIWIVNQFETATLFFFFFRRNQRLHFENHFLHNLYAIWVKVMYNIQDYSNFILEN